MRIVSIGCLVVFLLFAGGVSLGSGQVRETESEKWTTVALDLMDLEIPGEEGADQMDLPPIPESKRPADVVEPKAPEPEPPEAELSRTEVPEAEVSVQSPAPGMAPFLLEEGDFGRGGGKTRAATASTGEAAPEILLEELPTELKAVPPPPSRAESLKLPSELDGGASGEAAVPEIPLLKVDDSGGAAPVPGGQDSSLTMKPFTELREVPEVEPNSRPARKGRTAEDYLQVREEIDSRLIEIYERYYKDR
jgi:hypothetical protein